MVHRRRDGEVLLSLLAITRAVTELAEAEVAMGDQRAHAPGFGERQGLAVVAFGVLTAACRGNVAGEAEGMALDLVITDFMGVSGRKMIEALIAGESDPGKLGRLADPRVKASREALRQALRGRVTRQHRFLLRLHLDQMSIGVEN